MLAPERIGRGRDEDHVDPLRAPEPRDRDQDLAGLLAAREVRLEGRLLLEVGLPDLVDPVEDEPDREELLVEPTDLTDRHPITIDGVEAPELVGLVIALVVQGGEPRVDDIVGLAGDPDVILVSPLPHAEFAELGELDDLDALDGIRRRCSGHDTLVVPLTFGAF